jgi:parallel beta-helix repeat protein
MKVRISIIFVLLLLLFSSFNLFFSNIYTKAEGNEIYVDVNYHGIRDGSAEKPWNSIQEAIDKAEEGDTIYVWGGLYDETLFINKTLKIWGSIEGEETIIDSSKDQRYTIEITADNLELIDFTISDSNSVKTSPIGSLLYLAGDNIIIQGNKINNSASFGIYISPEASGCVISGNIIKNLSSGIKIESSDTNDIIRNTIENLSDYAIKITSSDNNRVYGNEISNATYALDVQKCNNINITNNTISHISYSTIYLKQSNNAIIDGNYLHNNSGDCVYLMSSDCEVIENIFNYNTRAINIRENGNIITDNKILNSSASGLYIQSNARNNIIFLNKFIDNTKSAVDDGNNIWYYDEKGNYWSDYNDLDKDRDGLGDVFYVKNGVFDEYPLGYFLKPPKKPFNPDPEDLETGVGLKIILEVEVEDEDSDELTVYFYNAENDELIDFDKKVLIGDNAFCDLTLGFNRTYAWYAIVNDSRQENKSNPWIFFTKTTPPDNEPPVADAGGPYENIGPGEIITFDGSDSYDTDGEIDFYRWNFGDGTSEILAKSPEHSFSSKGAYKVTLTVIDNDGTTDTEIIFITIGDYVNKKPNADHGGPYQGVEDENINFTAENSSDVDGIITEYIWSFGDGSTGYGETTIHKYEEPGTYIIELTVEDNNGDLDTVSTLVTIEQKTPGFEIFILVIALKFHL